MMILFGILGGSLAVNNTVPIFTDGNRNPWWGIDHAISANVCIGLGVLFMIIGFFLRKRDHANTS